MNRLLPIITLLLLVSCAKKELTDAVVEIIPVIKYSETTPGKFTFTVDGQNILNYKWDFGDKGASSSLPNPEYLYRFNGEYIVTAIVQTQTGSIQKTQTITTKVNVTSLKTATPKFQLILEADNRTVNVINPSAYIKKIEWEFIDKYEGTTKSSINNAKHSFKWNVEHQVKMTATVEAKNGDTTYTDLQNIKITGNPVPQENPLLSQSPFFIPKESFFTIGFYEFYQFVEIESGDETFGKETFGNGEMTKEQLQYSYFYPHKGPFMLKITVTNPNGKNTFTFPVNGNSYSTFLPTYDYTASSGVDIKMPPQKGYGDIGAFNIASYSVTGALVISPLPTSNLYQKIKVELPKVNGNYLYIGNESLNNQFTVWGTYTLPSDVFLAGTFTIKLKPENHRFIYIRDFNQPSERYICSPIVTILSTSIRILTNSTLKELHDFYSSRGDYPGLTSYSSFFNYFYGSYIPSYIEKNGWSYFSNFQYYEETKGEGK